MDDLRQRMVGVMNSRNFSPRTIKAYVWYVAQFAQMFRKSPTELAQQEIEMYLQRLRERATSWSMIRSAYSALKFLYVEVLQQPWTVEQPPKIKRERRLPVVLSGTEVVTLLDGVDNLKHRTILMTCYSAGLRVGEVVHLKVRDIDSKRMLIRVEQGKGRKDRYTLLSTTLLEQLRLYWQTYRPTEWLFPGYVRHRPLGERAVQHVFSVAKKKSVLPSRSPSTRSVTALQPTCWRRERTSSLFNVSLATPA
jgi:integrase/recombinase XerD